MKNELFLSANEIIEGFLNYIDNTIYNYAYMLDGSWGSGKTFFVKETLIPEIEKHEKEKENAHDEYKAKNILYVSLYGIRDTEEISRLIFVELRRLYANNKGNGKEKSKAKSIIGNCTKLISDVVKDLKGVDLEKIINDITSNIPLKNCILIFDDLERTKCNINDILGYINNYVEHEEIKVLLIANEKEINTNSKIDATPEELLVCLQDNLDFDFLKDNIKNIRYQDLQQNDKLNKISLEDLKKRVDTVFVRNQSYRKFKEKVVGETVRYQPNYIDMIKFLTEKHLADNDVLRNMIIRKADKLSEIASYYSHQNLRTFQFFLSKIVFVFDCLKEHQDTVENMIDYFFLVCIKYKAGNEITEWEKTREFEIRTLYGMFDIGNSCIAFKFIDEFVLYGKFNSDNIVEIVSEYEIIEKKNAEKTDDPVNKLQMWWTMDENTVKELLENIIHNLKENYYSFDIYLQILNKFTVLTCIGFDEKYLTELMESMKNNISEASQNVKLTNELPSFISDEDESLYNIKSSELKEVAEKSNHNIFNNELLHLVSNVSSWGMNFREYLYQHNSIEGKNIISKIDPYKIIELIENSDSENITKFRYSISDIYSFSNIADYYMKDYSNLKTIYDGLNENNPDYDLIKKINIKLLKRVIAEKMDLLKPDTEDNN